MLFIALSKSLIAIHPWNNWQFLFFILAIWQMCYLTIASFCISLMMNETETFYIYLGIHFVKCLFEFLPLYALEMLLPRCNLIFHYLNHVFWWRDVIHLNIVQFITSFIVNDFHVLFKKSLPTPASRKYVLININYFVFTFRHIISLELINCIYFLSAWSWLFLCSQIDEIV